MKCFKKERHRNLVLCFDLVRAINEVNIFGIEIALLNS